ncbi:P-loop containing nucleoside triphosphate hydrolase protein [Ustulina deusta]|nr:P-loop containing nucleoside triphosphate hydrolase protein [Ustulina deusta]
MEPRGHKGMDSAPPSIAYYDTLYANRQGRAVSDKYKGQGVPQSNTTTKGTDKDPGASSSRFSKENKPTRMEPGRKAAGNNKRKLDGSDPSTKAKPRKKQKMGKRRVALRKLEIKDQLGNMGGWTSRRTDLESANPEYTTEQYTREVNEHEDAKLVLGDKYKSEGREQDCGNELGRIDGMSSKIRDYQTVGAAFMVRQERSRGDCRGGIIADDMGIGKTVQSIACMLVHPPSKKATHNGQGTTLIIVPNQGLIKQWIEELFRHAKIERKKVCIYTGKSGLSALAIAAHPYVLVTYSQVGRDFRLFNSKQGNEGPLFEVKFFRILLDEGDNINNYYGNTSRACAELKGKLKWVLSGTPLRNGVDECLPYFRFLGIHVHEEQDSFSDKWGEPESDEIHNRTMQILAKIMLRREVGQMYLGREMCKLSKSHFEDRFLSITDEEKAVSRHLEQATCRVAAEAREQRKLEEGNEDEDENQDEGQDQDQEGHKPNFRICTTWLRQAVDHPLLLENCIRNIMNQDELESLDAELDKIELSRKEINRETPCLDEAQGSQTGGPNIYEIADIKSHIRDILSSWNNDENGGCLDCFTLVELQSLECGHAMCRTCYKKHVGDAATENKRQLRCPQCDKIFACIPKVKEELDDKWPSRERMKPRKEVLQTSGGRSVSVCLPSEMNKRSPGDDFNGMQPRSNHLNRWLRKCDEIGQFTTSTKTRVAIEIVVEWLKEAPDDQIIIFTEWITTARVLGRLLNKLNIKFVYYNGQMKTKHKDGNLGDFKSNPAIKVMVATIRSGNVGLNIANANRMIIMNPWWNHAAEEQAFGRIKRHGQRKETHLIRLFARDTIDERIYTLQNEKREEIRFAIRQGQKPKPLSENERYWLLTNRNAPESPLAESDEVATDDDSDCGDESDF